MQFFGKFGKKRMFAPTGRLAPPSTGILDPPLSWYFLFNRKQKNFTPFFGILVVIRPFSFYLFYFSQDFAKKPKKPHFSLHKIRLPE